ncbi:MAG: MFS transporter, partial [Oligoflexales bacterium]|nr:MFS transporter [Oligoflexales bacterium]
ALPSILFFKIFGNIIDRHNSKRILFYSSVIASLCVAFVLLSIHFLKSEALVIAFMAEFLIASFQALITPTLTKSIQELVDDDDIEIGTAFEMSTGSFTDFAGALFGGILIGIIGVTGVLALTFTGYFIAAVNVLFSTFKPIKTQTDSFGEETDDFSALQYLKSKKEIKLILLLSSFASFFTTPMAIVMPIYTMYLLKGDTAMLSYLEASISLGIIFGVFSERLFKNIKDLYLISANCAFIIALALAIPGIIVSLPLYAVSLFICGLALGVNNVIFGSFFQRNIDKEYKGRFFAFLFAMIGCITPASFFLFGLLVDYIGAKSVCIIEGLGLLFISLAFFRKHRSKTKGKLLCTGLLERENES